MSNFISQVLLAGGGAAVICGAILVTLWKLGIDSLLERLKQSQAESLERLKAELELGAARAGRFETAQFGAFQEIWDRLADLRIASNRLWQNASHRNIEDFGLRLEEARRTVYGSQLVIDGDDLRRLRTILHELESFYEGKEGLLQLRQTTPRDRAAIEHRIQENGHLRARFLDAVEDLRSSLQSQMRRTASNNRGV